MSADDQEDFEQVAKDLEQFTKEPQGASPEPFKAPQGANIKRKPYAKGGTVNVDTDVSPAPSKDHEGLLRAQLRAEIRKELEDEVRAEMKAARTVNVIDGFTTPDGQPTSVENEPPVKIHFVDDGFTVGGRMFYRGEEAMIPASTPWLAYNARQQIKIYGKRIFRTGPWDGESFDLSDPALTKADRERLKALETDTVQTTSEAQTR